MILLVDIGNSRIKWSSRNAGTLGDLQAAQYSKTEVNKCLDAHWNGLPQPEKLWVANVAGESVAHQVARWTVAHWGLEPQVLQVAGTAGQIRHGYANISHLGVDRWLALVATWQKYGTAACIVDCGTAVTIDGLDATGTHLGGLILPGVTMMCEALSRATGGIPANDQAQVVRGLAVNTGEGVMTGCTMAIVTLIEHTVDSLKDVVTGDLVCVITGGGAGNILPWLHGRCRYEPLLVLEGLNIVMAGKEE